MEKRKVEAIFYDLGLEVTHYYPACSVDYTGQSWYNIHAHWKPSWSWRFQIQGNSHRRGSWTAQLPLFSLSTSPAEASLHMARSTGIGLPLWDQPMTYNMSCYNHYTALVVKGMPECLMSDVNDARILRGKKSEKGNELIGAREMD